MGLEDFETSITEYVHHYDSFHTYTNLSTLLVNKASRILATEPALKASMKEMSIESTDDELAYLRTRVKAEVPEQEKLEIEYYLLLVRFKETTAALTAVQQVWIHITTPETVASAECDKTATIETQRRQARKQFKIQQEEVLAMEMQLGIMPQERWSEGDANWVLNAERAAMASYQKELDRLEGLVVERILELGKTNRSQTGYKMRKHIGNTVKTHSQAIRTALDKYNAAATKLTPPQLSLDWDTPWAKPAGRSLQEQHYKILQAWEEIQRCDIEISWLWTHMADETKLLEAREDETMLMNPALAYQIRQYRLEWGRFNAIHVKGLQKLAKDRKLTLTIRKHHDPQTFISPPPVQPPEDDRLTNADTSSEDDDDDGLTDADASADEDNEILEWWVKLVDIATDTG
ncbi:hypothetical protein C8J56DRAFT_879514 [Mycena floridula]|nr:hypothetical protein C8J56DRAFT_879514 [Mycena floridula]